MDKHTEQIGRSINPVRRICECEKQDAGRLDGVETTLAFATKDACRILGGISPRSLRRLEQRGLLLPSRGLRTKLYSRLAIEKYLGATL
jgi:hypothetical protein